MNAAGFASPASTSLDELVRLRQLADALARARRRSRAPQGGASRSRRLGRGLDFAEVREYQPGDDVRLIDWNVTARTQRVHTKLFDEELERPLHVVVDARATMRFGTRGCYKSVLAARLAAVLGWSAVAARDRVGGLVFGDGWHAEIRPAGGRRGLMALFRALVQAQNRVPVGPGARPGGAQGDASGDAPGDAPGDALGEAFERLATLAPPGSAVRILSDFAGLAGRGERALGSALVGLDVLGLRVVDPLDRALPLGPSLEVAGLPAQGRAGARRVRIGSRRQHEAHRARFERDSEALESVFARSRHVLLTVETGTPFAETAALALAPPSRRVAVPSLSTASFGASETSGARSASRDRLDGAGKVLRGRD